MRKTFDFTAALGAARANERRLKLAAFKELGELVWRTKAGVLDQNILAGALLAAATETDPEIQEGWRQRGAAYFQKRSRRRARESARREESGAAPGDGAAAPATQRPGDPAL